MLTSLGFSTSRMRSNRPVGVTVTALLYVGLIALVGCSGKDLREIHGFEIELDAPAAEINSNDQRHITIKAHNGCIYDIAYSPDGSEIATSSMDETLRIWDARTGQRRHSFAATGFVLAVCYSPDGRFLVAATIDHGIHLWDVSTWQSTVIARAKTQPQSLVFSPDGEYLAIGGSSIQLLRTNDWKATKSLTRHDQGGTGLAFSSDGKNLVSGNADQLAKVWSLPDLREISQSKYDSWVGDVDVDPSAARFAVSHFAPEWNSQIFVVSFLKLPDGSKLSELRGQTLRGHIPGHTRLKFSPNGKYLATALYGEHDTGEIQNDIIITEAEGDVSIWDPKSQRLLARKPDNKRAYCLAFSPDSKSLAVADVKGSLEIFDIAWFVEQWSVDRGGN